MKTATPSDKRVSLALSKINSFETEKIASRYRKLGGVEDHQFDSLVDVDLEEDWSPFPFRREFFQEIFCKNEKLQKAFDGFRKALARKYPEYKYLILRDDWMDAFVEIFLLGGIQRDTFNFLPKGNVFWSSGKIGDKALYLRILPGADKQQVVDFLSITENRIDRKFKELGILIPKVKNRTGKETSYELDFWVRVLDTFTLDEIRDVFALRFPEKYREEFTLNDVRKKLMRAKYELIAHYVFHRFKLSNKNSKPYKADYIKTILEKAKKDKTKLKSGSFKKIP